MTPAQLRLLNQSFSKIKPRSDQFGLIFYERLFVIAPELRPIFGTDIKLQQAKFMKVIKEVVELHLRSLISLPVTAKASESAVIPGAFWAGKLHVAYGVKLEDYETMKSALLWAIEQTLGNECTVDVKHAWSQAYDLVAGAMREGMLSPEDEDNEPENAMRHRIDSEKQFD
jgi:nitric oxide dioxygenase